MSWFSFGSKSKSTPSVASRAANRAMDAQRSRERQQEAARRKKVAAMEKGQREVMKKFNSRMKREFGNKWN